MLRLALLTHFPLLSFLEGGGIKVVRYTIIEFITRYCRINRQRDGAPEQYRNMSTIGRSDDGLHWGFIVLQWRVGFVPKVMGR